ncbi:MAG TPA: carboxymuconolactone decarboxylase family protein [Arthrobacter sp.]|nr:carboxymuconolactone decarboxylase family protein [Arthrobacter sp.]
MSERVNLSKQDPAAYQALLAMNKVAGESAAAAGLDPLLVELVKIRASQINGCSFCLRMHTRDAIKHGETADRLSVVPAWRESEYFSSEERAALELAESVTLVADGQVPDEVYERVAAALSPAQISAVGWLTMAINVFNRVAVTSRYHVGP